MDSSLKNGIRLNEAAYLILSDLHLSKEHFNSKELINKLRCNKNLSVVLLGDTFQGNRTVAINHNEELMKEIWKHHPIYICGNNDPDFGFDYATFNERILCHGNQFCLLTRFKFVNRILNFFKTDAFRGENTGTIPQEVKSKLARDHYVIGHFHKDCYIVSSRLLAPRKLYLMTKDAITELS